MTTETLPAVAPAEPTTPIRPSEALRLGRLLRPIPLTGNLFGADGEACALGAMLAGGGHDGGTYSDLARRFGSLGERPPVCPALTDDCEWHGQQLNLREAIWGLNDIHRWPSARIADWLESLGL